MLEVNNIEVVYNSVILVLRGISFKVEQGQAVTLMGPNGAGKSTTLKAISGLLRGELGEVTRGRILWKGQRIDQMPAEDIVRQGIVQVIEGRPLFEHLSVEENLKIGAMVYNSGREATRDIERMYAYFPRLKTMRRRTSGYLSGGEQQMLVIGRALMSHPELIMLDEPSLGLAPMLVEEIFEIVKEIREKDKISVLLVEQNAHAALGLADYGYVMEQGRIVLDGHAAALAQNEDIKEFYLGLSQLGERKSYREVKHYRRRKRWTG
ncbi:MAG TPA: ABC transporter ATP-binding protein [Aggregatilineales bacterium]|nr:ABC transporter ATP-binding protein [Aggregatilineales bacterium]